MLVAMAAHTLGTESTRKVLLKRMSERYRLSQEHGQQSFGALQIFQVLPK